MINDDFMMKEPSDFVRSESHRRNEKLEILLYEINSLLNPVEEEIISSHDKNNFPLVLLMGNPRSGTTLFMQWLASLGHFSYPSNLLSRFYAAPAIGAKIQLMLTKYDFNNELYEFDKDINYKSRLGKTKGILSPNEFWYFWRRFFPNNETHDISDEELKKIDNVRFVKEIAAIESVFNSPFAMKGTLFSWNVPYFSEIFDKLLLVKLTRNPFYVIQSLLNARIDYYNNINAWYSCKPPEYHDLKYKNPIEQVVGQVFYTSKALDLGFSKVDEPRKLIFDYEDFCSDPKFIFDCIKSKFEQQGFNVDWSYNGPESFSVERKVSLDGQQVDNIISAYYELSGETISP